MLIFFLFRKNTDANASEVTKDMARTDTQSNSSSNAVPTISMSPELRPIVVTTAVITALTLGDWFSLTDVIFSVFMRHLLRSVIFGFVHVIIFMRFIFEIVRYPHAEDHGDCSLKISL